MYALRAATCVWVHVCVSQTNAIYLKIEWKFILFHFCAWWKRVCVWQRQQQQPNHWSRLICSLAIDLDNNSSITISSKTLFFRIPIYLLHLKFICIELLNPFRVWWMVQVHYAVRVCVLCAAISVGSTSEYRNNISKIWTAIGQSDAAS